MNKLLRASVTCVQLYAVYRDLYEELISIE